MMPDITAIALESLIHSRSSRDSLGEKASLPESREEAEEWLVKVDGKKEPPAQRFYSPALYATPQPAPIPDVSSICWSPTTYVINYKRRDVRGGCLGGGFDVRKDDDGVGRGDAVAEEEKDEEEEIAIVGGSRGLTGIEEVEISEQEEDVFFDPLDSISFGTNHGEVEDGTSSSFHGCSSQFSFYNQSQSEYCDTTDEFLSDASLSSSSPSFIRSCEKELHVLRVTFLEEASRRKKAEETLVYMNEQWEKVVKCLFQIGPSFPEMQQPEKLQDEIDLAQICQERVFLKFVSESLERDLSKEETEDAMMKLIASKNYELSRLRNRMQYYESMNREMCQRNQDAVDLSRHRRDSKRRWIWSCIGLSLTVGASLFAYSYLHGKDLPLAPRSEASHSSTTQ
ncbi:hypothetical protein AXF42_Ash007841 [Apostasia shenzhenica]|uniref:Uncharacterized protein n=1 Tax=Apostasia shenzhenica TaxID=1088818 RepID=A0A2I0B5I2_9ASPA|nr:hypothetical protein AXF42_Ash007841 [Apostasia shenzhenica]